MDLRELSAFVSIPHFEQVNILDLGARNDGDAPIYSQLTSLLPCRVLGIDTDPSLAEAFCTDVAPPSCASYRAATLGDGTKSEFFECGRSSVSSLLRPEAKECHRYDGLAEATNIINTRFVQTTKLSDVAADFDADLIKSDLQGADVHVLRHGRAIVQSAPAILIEVDFIQQYSSEPLFWDVARELREWGLFFHSFIEFGTRPLAGFLDSVAEQPRRYRQWLWANALFVANPDRWSEYPIRKLLAFSVLMHVLFRSTDYALDILKIYDKLTGGNASIALINALSPQG